MFVGRHVTDHGLHNLAVVMGALNGGYLSLNPPKGV
jgi:hypothetical protein